MIALRQTLRILLLFLVVGGAALSVPAADHEVSAFVQPASGITEGRPFQLVIEASGPTSPRMAPPRIPELENLRVVGGPSTNSQHVFSGGRSNAKFQLIYTLLARGPGPASIPTLEVEVDGKVHRTEPIQLSVAAAPSGQPPQSPGPGRGAPSRGAPAREQNRDLFIRAELGAGNVWVGQPVTLTLTLYTAERVGGLEGRSVPALADFWVEELEVDVEAEAYRTQIEGRPYTAYPLERKLLVAPGPGEFEIEPYVVAIQVRQARGDLFDIFSMGRGETVVRATEPLKLQVRALPADQPQGFSGAVGEFSMRVSLDREHTAVNDAVALRATVEGEGLLRAVEAPILDAPADVKIFDPKVTESTSTVRGKIGSRKTWEWVIVPLTAGELRIPELRFPYFNPAEGKYRTARGEPLEITVRRDDRSPDAPLARGDIQLQRREPAFIKALRNGRLAERRRHVHRSGGYLALLFLPIVAAPILIVLGRRRERLQRDQGLVRGRRAGNRARKRLRAMSKRSGQFEPAEFHEEIGRTLVEYVSDRFNRSAAGMTYEVADELLASRGVSPDLRRRFRSCLETCDFARFVPASGKTERREEVLAEALGLVEELERAW